MLAKKFGGEEDRTKSLPQMMEELLSQSNYSQNCSPAAVWEALTTKIQSAAIIFRKRRKNSIKKSLQTKIEKLHKLNDQGKCPQTDPEAAELSQEIEVLANKVYLNTTSSIAIKMGKEGDRPSRTFLSTGKKTTGKTKIHHIKTNHADLTGNEATNHMMQKFQQLLGSPS